MPRIAKRTREGSMFANSLVAFVVLASDAGKDIGFGGVLLAAGFVAFLLFIANKIGDGAPCSSFRKSPRKTLSADELSWVPAKWSSYTDKHGRRCMVTDVEITPNHVFIRSLSGGHEATDQYDRKGNLIRGNVREE